MTEITRVPIQPIAKGSLAKLWLGVVAVVVAAIIIAWLTMMPQGVTVQTITAGSGENPGDTDVVFVRYTGKLADGTVFDQSQDVPLPIPGILPAGTPLPLDSMIPGFREAMVQTQRGGTYEVFIPAAKGYGDDVPPGGPIPPGADLIFDIEMVDFMPRAEFEQRVAAIQQMLSQMPEPDGPQAPAPAP